MATPRDIRRLAFQALYQLDARRDEPAEAVLSAVMDEEDEPGRIEYTPGEKRKAFLLASQAFADRAAADAFMQEAAPDWPTHRQAAVDRAILRLAYHEMNSGHAPAKVAVNEAVELAKLFSTEKSPSFINGLLDKAMKKFAKDASEKLAEASSLDVQAAPDPSLSPSTNDDAGTGTVHTIEHPDA